MDDQQTKKQRRLQEEAERLARLTSQNKNQLLLRVLLWTGAALGLIGMVWGLAKLATTTNTSAVGGTLQDQVTMSDWSQGNSEAKNILVEYSDFQCPACAAFEPQLKQALATHGDRLRLVYRHFPLPQHANASLAAAAAEAAGKQNKFWQMHGMLFDRQNLWEKKSNADAKATFTQYAQELGLNTAQFSKDSESKETQAQVDADLSSGARANVRSTPSFYLNNQKLDVQKYDSFAEALEENLVK